MGKRVVVESHLDQQHQDHQHTNSNPNHTTPVTTGARKIRKRKCNSNGNNIRHVKTHKTQRLSSSPGHNSNDWHDNDDEDSSSNDGPPLGQLAAARNVSTKQANNSSILLNNSLNITLTNNEPNASLNESPKPVYTLRPSVVNGTVLHDLNEKPWRLGRPIGKGNFGEIFLASDNISIPVTNENAKFVVKIEPHSNGPLFVEIHCLMNTAKKEKYEFKSKPSGYEENNTIAASNALPLGEPCGIPDYIASGSHYFGNARYRFLVLPRFDRDLHSLIKKCRVHQKSVLTLAIHIITVLEHLHDKGYCHNDVKAQNLMISKCKYLAKQNSVSTAKKESSSYTNKNCSGNRTTKPSGKYDHYEEKQQTTDSGNSSEQEANDDDGDDDFVVKRRVYNEVIDDDYEDSEGDGEDDDLENNDNDEEEDDEDFDDGATTNSTNSNSMDNYRTPINKKRLQRKKSARSVVQYSGSNPVRSCRKVNGEKPNSIYDEMVKSHYLRPTKRVSYLEFFNEDNSSAGGNSNNDVKSNLHSNSSDDESEEFVPLSIQRSIKRGTPKNSCSVTTLLESRRLTRRQEKLLGTNKKLNAHKDVKNEDTEHDKKMLSKSEPSGQQEQWVEVEEERIFLIDFGLASKYIDNGVHRPFVMDQRRAHDGTLEYTSRDAHMGAHSRRSDMECLGYNLLFWSQGYLPWKEAATNQQQEKVHRAKEYLMTDVRELLRQIYGKQVPNYIGEYLHLVGQLAYHERPDYKRYRHIFEREYQQLGYPLPEMRLQMREIQRTCVRVKEEIENKNDFFDMTKSYGVLNAAYSIMQNTNSCGTPFHERTLSNRVSPKNLRSKSDKKASKKNKFSWTEILSQDPDQIARERAEKEFDREEELSDVQQSIVRRYQGKPTYAILEILDRMGRTVDDYEKERDDERKIKREHKAKELKEEDVEIDECDGYEPIYADDSEDAETEATETSEHRKTTTTNSRVRSKLQKSNKIVSVKVPKTSVSRRLVLKTPNNNNAVGKSDGTPIGKRTRCQKVKITPHHTPASPVSAAKRKKSATKSVKRGSAISKGNRKTPSSGDTEPAVASAAGEVEQQQQQEQESIYHSKRERRTRRCLVKTERLQASADGLLEDDSNSNFSPEGFQWKSNNHQTENVYARIYRK